MSLWDAAEEKIDSAKTKLRDKSEERSARYGYRAAMVRRERDEENDENRRSGRISSELHERRKGRSERQYAKERAPPEQRMLQGSTKLAGTGKVFGQSLFSDAVHTAQVKEHIARQRSQPRQHSGRSVMFPRVGGSSGILFPKTGGGSGVGFPRMAVMGNDGVDFSQLRRWGNSVDFGKLRGGNGGIDFKNTSLFR